jgi:hypothetical protein
VRQSDVAEQHVSAHFDQSKRTDDFIFSILVFGLPIFLLGYWLGEYQNPLPQPPKKSLSMKIFWGDITDLERRITQNFSPQTQENLIMAARRARASTTVHSRKKVISDDGQGIDHLSKIPTLWRKKYSLKKLIPKTCGKVFG